MSTEKQPTGNFRWKESESKVLQQQFGCKNNWAWSGLEWRDVPTVGEQIAPTKPINNIDPRWADIDFDKVNAELRDLRAQVGRLQAHIDRTQPVVAGADGYVEAPTQAHGEVEYFGLEPWERDKLTSPTAGMNIAQRILHVGGRNNEAGYVEFGSIQAVEALVRQVLRDLPAQGGPNA